MAGLKIALEGFEGCGSGLVVGVLAFYSDDLSSNPSWLKKISARKDKNKCIGVWGWPIFRKGIRTVDPQVVVEAYGKTAYANPLNPDAFPGIRKMEAEVVRMTCNLFHGDPETSCGTVSRLTFPELVK